VRIKPAPDTAFYTTHIQSPHDGSAVSFYSLHARYYYYY